MKKLLSVLFTAILALSISSVSFASDKKVEKEHHATKKEHHKALKVEHEKMEKHHEKMEKEATKGSKK